MPFKKISGISEISIIHNIPTSVLYSTLTNSSLSCLFCYMDLSSCSMFGLKIFLHFTPFFQVLKSPLVSFTALSTSSFNHHAVTCLAGPFVQPHTLSAELNPPFFMLPRSMPTTFYYFLFLSLLRRLRLLLVHLIFIISFYCTLLLQYKKQ